MRKGTGVLLALVVCLMLTACTPGKEPQGGTEATQGFFDGDTPMPRYDADNQYLLWAGISIQEIENYIFGTGLGREYLHYYDLQTGVSGLLCPDPACTHDSNACSAKVGLCASVSLESCTGWERTRQGADATVICGVATSPAPTGRS